MPNTQQQPLPADSSDHPALLAERVLTAGDAITRRLRDAIVFAELPPGTRLKQEELARRFGTSRVPLREALRQLSAEGLVDWPSNRSATVRSLSYEELEELFALGALLETRATALGVPRLTEEDLATLRRLHASLGGGSLALPSWYRINLDFHLLPMLRSGQRHTLELVTAIRLNLTRHFLSPALYERDGEDWRRKHQREHARLLAAFVRRDGEKARNLVERHWRSTWADWNPHLKRRCKEKNVTVERAAP